MSNEISVSASLAVTKGSLSDSKPFAGTLNLTTAAPSEAGGAVSVPTTSTGTALGLGSVTTLGWAWFKNTDPTNYIELGVQVSGAFVPFARLLPGEPALLRLGTAAPYARSNTAACILEYAAFDT